MTDSITIMRSVHGLFNFSVMLLFVYQASMGLKIRRGRRAGQLPAETVVRHRRNGPFLVILAGLGYVAGLIIVIIDQGRVFSFPLHI